MKMILASLLLLAAVISSAGELDSNLEALKPFLGTWRGEFKGSSPEKPVVDVTRWERALNGKAVRIVHSINDGEYGGEAIVTWDTEKKSLVYHYFTTAGFMTKGTMKVNGKMLESHETVSGAQGATEVKAVYELKEDGRLHSVAKYLKDGNWDQGREAIYQRAPDAKPVFK